MTTNSEGHTEGPFEVQNPMGDDEGLWIVQAGLEAYEWSCIAIVPRDEDRSGKHFITKREQYANAALFAAAPTMLDALKAVWPFVAKHYSPNIDAEFRLAEQVNNALRAANSLATGASDARG